MSPTAPKLITEFTDVQTLPHVMTELLKLISDSSTTMKQFEEVIQLDPILEARLLSLINSPVYGLRQQIDSIGRAVAYLGMKNLRNIVVTDTLFGILRQEAEESDVYSRKQLWLHCAAVSVSSKMVAERIFGINGADAYLCGILHDIGLIVEEQVRRDQFLTICGQCSTTSEMIEMERNAFGTDHCNVGCLLVNEWSIAEPIQEAIRDHHTQLDEVEPSSLTGILQISEYLTTQHDYSTLPGLEMQISLPLLVHIEEHIDEYRGLLEDFPEEMTRVKELYGGGDD